MILYTISDNQFLTELEIRAYIDQVAGYPIGHPRRKSFKPLFPVLRDSEDGPIDRQGTLNLPCFRSFAIQDREILLQKAENSNA